MTRPTRARHRLTRRPRLEPLEDRCVLSFGTNGIVLTDVIPNYNDLINSVALQPADGKIVVAGNGGLARYLPDGALDTSFNSGGSQPGTIPLPYGPDYFNDVVVQSDGKILAAGTVINGSSEDFLLRRFLADGSPDPSFGTAGVVTTGFKSGGNDEIYALALQPDGKIVAAGNINHSWSGGAWAVARYNANGSLDTTFDRDGWLTTTFQPGQAGIRDVAYAIAVQPDGKLVVAGDVNGGSSRGRDFAVARYNSNGALDKTFGSSGKATIDFGAEIGASYGSDRAYDMALQADGKIVLVGSASGPIDYSAVARLRNNPERKRLKTRDSRGPSQGEARPLDPMAIAEWP